MRSRRGVKGRGGGEGPLGLVYHEAHTLDCILS